LPAVRRADRGRRLVLRFTYQQIVFESAWVVEMVREALCRPTGRSPQIVGTNLLGERDESVGR
jgi:hypothetical protein